MPDKKENVTNPVQELPPPPPEQPRFKTDYRDSDDALLALAIDKEGVAVSLPGIKVSLRK